jgi:hypothetical protein
MDPVEPVAEADERRRGNVRLGAGSLGIGLGVFICVAALSAAWNDHWVAAWCLVSILVGGGLLLLLVSRRASGAARVGMRAGAVGVLAVAVAVIVYVVIAVLAGAIT